MPTLYFHSVPISTVEIPHSHFTHETAVTKVGSVFHHRVVDDSTGAVHERFFYCLRDFVIWHYEQLGYQILDRTHPFEEEVKVLRRRETGCAYEASLKEVNRFFQNDFGMHPRY
jgi:hypothetical protein